MRTASDVLPTDSQDIERQSNRTRNGGGADMQAVDLVEYGLDEQAATSTTCVHMRDATGDSAPI